MVGIICPPPVGIGLTDLPNIGGPVAPLAPSDPAPLTLNELDDTLIQLVQLNSEDAL